MADKPVWVITGASSDIGSALARHLDKQGDVRLILTSRSGAFPVLKGEHLLLHPMDLLKKSSVLKLKEAIETQTTGPFTVVHCAGDFWNHKPLVETEFDEIAGMVQSHYVTLSAVAWAVLPVMMERGGRIIAFSCNSVGYSYPDMSPFTAAKAAIESFIKCIANEYSQFGIIANALALPTIRTPKVIQSKMLENPDSYIGPDELAQLIVETIATASQTLNGNVMKIFRYSESFFHKSYYDRNPRTPQKVQP